MKTVTLSVVVTDVQLEAIKKLAAKHYPDAVEPGRGNASQYMRFRGLPAVFKAEGVEVEEAAQPDDARAVAREEVRKAITDPATVKALAKMLLHEMSHGKP